MFDVIYVYISIANTLSQAHKLVPTMLKMSSIRCTPKITNSSWIMIYKFGSKEHLKRPWNLCLSLRRRPRRFWSRLRGLDWLKPTSRCSEEWLERAASSNNQRRNCENARLLWEDSEVEEQVFVLPDFSVWFRQVIFWESRITTGTGGHWGLVYTLTEAKFSLIDNCSRDKLSQNRVRKNCALIRKSSWPTKFNNVEQLIDWPFRRQNRGTWAPMPHVLFWEIL